MKEALAHEDLLDELRTVVDTWLPRLRINERVSVKVAELESSDGADAECAMFPAEAVPESEGLWDFELVLDPRADRSTGIERLVVHELVHILLEPLRRRVFYGMPTYGARSPRQAATVEQWETVVQRLADTYLHYEDRAADALYRPSLVLDSVLGT